MLTSNIAENQRQTKRQGGGEAKVEARVLDWEQALSLSGEPAESASESEFPQPDLVVLSDCTYNVDSLPALVGTLKALMRGRIARCQGQGVRLGVDVLVALKRRHESETVFFEMMNEAGFEIRSSERVRMLDMSRMVGGDEEEVVEIFGFRRGKKAPGE